MKTYRTCLADAFAMEDVLLYLCSRVDCMEEEAQRNAIAMQEDPDDVWRAEQVSEYTAKAAAFERLIAKLTK